MRIFYGMLDQSRVNAMILYFLNQKNEKMIRRDFLDELGFALIRPHLGTRL